MGEEQNVIRAGAAAIIRKADGRIMIGKRIAFGKVMWVFPGGGIEFGERSEDAVVREVKEETGLDVKPRNLITVFEMIVPERKVHRVIFYYEADVVGGSEKPSEDIQEIRWLNPNEIALMDDLGDATIPALKAAKLI